MREIIKYLMLEKRSGSIPKNIEGMWVIIDKIIRDELEDMNKLS